MGSSPFTSTLFQPRRARETHPAPRTAHRVFHGQMSSTPDSSPTVRSIHTYPVKGEPGTDLAEVVVEPDGLAGDRRKGAPVHLVAVGDADGIRANLVLDLGTGDLPGAGATLWVGAVQLTVTGPAKTCPGVYADVARPGPVRVGDVVSIAGSGVALPGGRSPYAGPGDESSTGRQ